MEEIPNSRRLTKKQQIRDKIEDGFIHIHSKGKNIFLK